MAPRFHCGDVIKLVAMASEKFKSCIDACYECATLCDRCAAACLQEHHIKTMARCIELDSYCAEICRLTAHFLAKGEMYSKEVCGLCEQICSDCAAECGQHTVLHCEHCAEACKRCSEECRRMLL